MNWKFFGLRTGRTSHSNLLLLLLVAAIASLWVGVASGGVSIDTTNGVANTTPGTEAATGKVSWVITLIPVVVPLVIAVIKFFLPKLPSAWLPILAPILGAAVDLVCGGTWGSGTIMAAIAGSAGVGLREIVDQMKKRGGGGGVKTD
jgi:hypothetical protein